MQQLTACFCAIIVSAAVGCGSTNEGANLQNDESTPPSDIAARKETSTIGQDNDGEQKVLIDTSLGQITVLLESEKAALTVNNFLDYVDAEHYTGTIFHEVYPGFAVLGGSYTQDMTAKPTRPPIRNEAHNGLKNVRGTIAMVRRPDVIDSATCQFLFNLADNEELDHKDVATAEGYGYCVFGQVLDGLDVLNRISSQKVHRVAVPDGEPFENVPVEAVVIKSIRRVH